MPRPDNSKIHDWYRHVYAYSDSLVRSLIDELEIETDDTVLDPFNGTGTTTVVAKEQNIHSIGADINPVSVLSGRVKTTWDVDTHEVAKRKNTVLAEVEPALKEITEQNRTTLGTFTDTEPDADLSQYDFNVSDMLPTGWLTTASKKKVCVLRHHIEALPQDEVTNLLRLAMLATLPEEIANVGFGPEAYRTEPDRSVSVYQSYAHKVDKIVKDLNEIQQNGKPTGKTEIIRADARKVGEEIVQNTSIDGENDTVDFVITSPPYPAEHDYTRNQRLELVWLDAVTSTDDLRSLKKSSIRSHSKGIYEADSAGEEYDIRDIEAIDKIVSEMEAKIEDGEELSGFEKTYPRVVEEYFAGMQQHLESVRRILSDDAVCAYIVADQHSYWGVPIKTGNILSTIAETRVGFANTEIREWRSVRSTTGETEDSHPEEILFLYC